MAAWPAIAPVLQDVGRYRRVHRGRREVPAPWIQGVSAAPTAATPVGAAARSYTCEYTTLPEAGAAAGAP